MRQYEPTDDSVAATIQEAKSSMSLDKLYSLLAEYEKAVEDLERLRAHNELWPKSAIASVWHTREDRVIAARLALRKLLEAAA